MTYGDVYKILDAMLKHYRRETRTSQEMGADARDLSAYIAWVLEKINTIRSADPMERDIENAYAISCYMSRIKMRQAEYIKKKMKVYEQKHRRQDPHSEEFNSM